MTPPQPDAGEVARIAKGLTKAQREAVNLFYESDYGWKMHLSNTAIGTLLALEKRGVLDVNFRPTPLGLAVRRHIQESDRR